MSDDLISRSALVKEIKNMKVSYGNDNESYISMPRVLDIISEQPTAYDVEEKIELNITYEIDCYKHKYCPECGQRIDWGGQSIESEE